MSVTTFGPAVLQLPKFWTKNSRSKQKCLICGENHSQKDAQKEKPENQNVPAVRDPMFSSYRGCPEYKKQAFRQQVVNKQKDI